MNIVINILEENNYEFKWFGNMTASCKNYAYDKNFCSTTELNSTYYVFNSFFATKAYWGGSTEPNTMGSI